MDKKNINATKLRKEINLLFLNYETARTVASQTNNKPQLSPTNDYSKLLVNTNAEELIEQLLKKIDEWIALQEPGSEANFMGIIMKATALRLKSQLQSTLAEKTEILYEALRMIKPFGETAKGFYPYMNVMIILSEWHRTLNENDKATKFLLNAKEIHDRFVVNNKDLLWDYDCIFSGKPPTVEVSDTGKHFFKTHLAYSMYIYYQLERPEVDKAETAQYLIPAIQYVTGLVTPVRAYTMFYCLTDLIYDLLPLLRFKQLDHCLAGLMFHLVRYRRSVQKSEQKEVMALQFKAAKMFVLWGTAIGNLSAFQLKYGNDADKESNDIDNESYVEMACLKEPGVEIYEHQFPIKLVDTREGIEKIYKRVQKWDKKTAELCVESGVDEEWVAGKIELENLSSPFCRFI